MSDFPEKERKECFWLLPDKSGAANPRVLKCLGGWMTGVIFPTDRLYTTPTFVQKMYQETSRRTHHIWSWSLTPHIEQWPALPRHSPSHMSRDLQTHSVYLQTHSVYLQTHSVYLQTHSVYLHTRFVCLQTHSVYLQTRFVSKHILFTSKHVFFASKHILFTSKHVLFTSKQCLFISRHVPFTSTNVVI